MVSFLWKMSTFLKIYTPATERRRRLLSGPQVDAQVPVAPLRRPGDRPHGGLGQNQGSHGEDSGQRRELHVQPLRTECV